GDDAGVGRFDQPLEHGDRVLALFGQVTAEGGAQRRTVGRCADMAVGEGLQVRAGELVRPPQNGVVGGGDRASLRQAASQTARSGAGVSHAATHTSTNARSCTIRPKAFPASGSPKTRMPPAMPVTVAAVAVTVITGTASPSCRPRAEA